MSEEDDRPAIRKEEAVLLVRVLAGPRAGDTLDRLPSTSPSEKLRDMRAWNRRSSPASLFAMRQTCMQGLLDSAKNLLDMPLGSTYSYAFRSCSRARPPRSGP